MQLRRLDTKMTRNTINDWANYWRNEIGFNIIPAQSKKKSTFIEWSYYQDNLVSEVQYNKWITNGDFNQGIAIIVGKIWRGKYNGKYLACIDIDNKKGIEEFLSHFGKVDTIEKLAKMTIVEWHSDNPNKVHIYFIVEKPLHKKSGIVGAKDNPGIPAIEVKSEGSHGIIFCTPSPHEDGYNYQIIGTKEPTVLDKQNSEALENAINVIYQKYESTPERNRKNGLIPIENLFKDDFTIYKGNNRHEGLLRVMESLIIRNSSIMSEDKVKTIAYDWNQSHCEAPLDDKEFEKQWKDARKFIAKNDYRENQENEKSTEEVNSIADILLSVNERYIEIFYDRFNKLYVTLKVNEHTECVRLDSNRFKSVLRTEYYNKEHKILTDDKLEAIIKLIESQLTLDESIQKRELGLRVAKVDENSIYYDLTTSKWEIVRISKEGWEILQNNQVPIFKRYDTSSIPQFHPSKDYDNDIFDKFIKLFNLGSKNDKILLSVLIITLFIPSIPKPILILSGDGGGAKTTTFNIIKRIVDPGSTDTIAFPKQINDLVQILDHNYVNCFDNVSSISEEISDLLCRAVTGAGYSKRALYTDDSDMIYKFKRFIAVNGINLATTRADFLDRSIITKANRIEDKFRKKEADIDKEIEKLKPYVLGYIFDILVKVLKYKDEHPNEKIFENGFPRMADFAEWGEIIARCLGYKKNEFINAYYENINSQNDEVIESSPIAEAILLFVRDREVGLVFRGTPSKLHTDLTNMIDQVKPDLKKSNLWPKASSTLTPKINEVKPNLKQRGVEITTGERDNEGNRVITITKLSSIKKNFDDNEESGQVELGDILTNEEEENEGESFNPNIYRIGSTDTWGCYKCPLREDIHFMKQHICTNNRN